MAEGIEEAGQAAWLVSLGCPLGQGYLYSRPMGVDATEAFLAADATRRIQDGSQTVAVARRRTRRTIERRLRLVSGE